MLLQHVSVKRLTEVQRMKVLTRRGIEELPCRPNELSDTRNENV